MKPRVAAVVALVAGGRLLADEGTKPREYQAPIVMEAPPTPIDGRPRTVAQDKPRPASGVAHVDPRLGRVRAVEIREGEAKLVLADGPRTLHVGDVVSGDTVKVIEPGRVVLTRPDPQGGPDAIVIVRFDEKGRGRVSVYSARDTSPAAPRPPSEE